MLNLLALSAGKVDHRVIGCGSVCKTPLFGLVEQRYRPLGVDEYGRALIAKREAKRPYPTRKYLQGRIHVPGYSYAWAQPLEPFTQKALPPGVQIVDPIYAPPKREDTVKNLLAAVSDVLACEEGLFERLKGDDHVPPFEKPEPAKVDYLEFQRPLPGSLQVSQALSPLTIPGRSSAFLPWSSAPKSLRTPFSTAAAKCRTSIISYPLTQVG
jgi:hypothetical protein